MESVNRTRERTFHLFYSYALLPLNKNERTYFRSVEYKREYFGRVQSAFKAPLNILNGIMHDDATCTFLTRSKCY